MSQTVPTVTAAKRRQRCPAAFCFWGRGGHVAQSTPRLSDLSERFGIYLDRVGRSESQFRELQAVFQSLIIKFNHDDP